VWNGYKIYNLHVFYSYFYYTKALDYVVRESLWYKFIHLGLRGNILNIIKSIYDSIVKFCNNLSDDYACALGLRQDEC
jgi:hypothetical protein